MTTVAVSPAGAYDTVHHAGSGVFDPPPFVPDGNWWYEQQGVAQAHAAGFTGKGVPIAVIAQGITPELPVLADADLTVHEPSFCEITGRPDMPVGATWAESTMATVSGSNAVAMIVGNGRGFGDQVSVSGIAPDASIRFYAMGFPMSGGSDGNCNMLSGPELATARALVQAVDDGARIVALTSTEVRASREISEAIAYALNQEVVVIVPAEPGRWIHNVNGLVTVRAMAEQGWGRGDGETVTVGYPGRDLLVQGGFFGWNRTELSSEPNYPVALLAGMLAATAQKWPVATNNQLIQSLIHNTAEPLPHDDGGNGYGVGDLTLMLQADPTQYPDTNPLIVDDDGQRHGLTAERIRDATRPAWAPPLPSQDPDPSERSSAAVWIIVGVAAVAIVMATFGFLVWRRRSSRQKRAAIDQKEE